MGSGSSDDYYALLGVEAGAGVAELRRAWRRLALRWHPDRAGSAATLTFQKISAAYSVLSDPAARAAYDRRQGSSPQSRDATARGPSAAASTTATPSAPAVLLQRLSGPLVALLACGAAELAEDGAVELFLNAQEAADGGMATISMRVDVHCPACAGGANGTCARCGGKRTVEELFSAWLAVPPGVHDGAVLAPSALLPGMVRKAVFRIRLD